MWFLERQNIDRRLLADLEDPFGPFAFIPDGKCAFLDSAQNFGATATLCGLVLPPVAGLRIMPRSTSR
jgi:hypothetical protein